MTDHQTSSVGEDAERADFMADYRKRYKIPDFIPDNTAWAGTLAQDEFRGWQAARRAAPALDAPIPSNSGELADAEILASGTAPTQPKAQVGSIEDYAQFHHLLDSWMGLSGEHQNDAAPQVAEAWRKFIDYIGVWAGSRAGDAAPDGWRLTPEQPTNKMTAIGQDLRYKSVNSIGAIYRAMLAAAPAPGKPTGNDQDDSA